MEVGNVIGVQLAVDTDNLVVEVLSKVGLDILGLEGLEFAVVLLTLKARGERESTLRHDRVGGVTATSLHSAEDTISADVVGLLSVVG